MTLNRFSNTNKGLCVIHGDACSNLCTCVGCVNKPGELAGEKNLQDIDDIEEEAEEDAEQESEDEEDDENVNEDLGIEQYNSEEDENDDEGLIV